MKAGFLGLAVVVAAYFWTPLVWGWIGKKDKDAPIAAAPSVAASVGVAVGPTAVPDALATGKDAGTDHRLHWSEIVQQIHDDPRMMTAPPLTKTRDPFEPPRNQVAESAAEAEQHAEAPPAMITPAEAGLVLTSTIVGPRRRIAQISGKTYEVGQSIEVLDDAGNRGVVFKLVEVQARRATLEADGQRFELAIPEPDKSNKIELFGAAAAR